MYLGSCRTLGKVCKWNMNMVLISFFKLKILSYQIPDVIMNDGRLDTLEVAKHQQLFNMADVKLQSPKQSH